MAPDRWRPEEKDWERTEGFRETMLVSFRPRQARTLRRLARMLFVQALESCEQRLPRKGSWTAGNLRAAARDLAHLTCFLRATAETADEEVGLGPNEGARLAMIATRVAEEIGQLTADLDDALGARR
jgi:hypothetical protein